MRFVNNSDDIPEPQSGVTSYEDPNAPWNQVTEENVADWNADVIKEFRANAGQVGGAYAGGQLLLLTTTGAISGKPHVVPLGPLYRDSTLYVSSFIEDKYPAWWHNLRAHPAVTVELGDKTYPATGRALEGAEYSEFAAWVLADNPMLAEFQATITRPIPLATLTLHGSP